MEKQQKKQKPFLKKQDTRSKLLKYNLKVGSILFYRALDLLDLCFPYHYDNGEIQSSTIYDDICKNKEDMSNKNNDMCNFFNDINKIKG